MNDRDNNVWTGVWGGYYDRFLPAWLETYGERCRVEFFDDLVTDPNRLLAGVCRWLDIDPVDVDADEMRTQNATVAYRSPMVQRGAAALAKAARPVLHRYPQFAAWARNAYQAVNERSDTSEEISDDVRRQLQALYAPSNALLHEQLVAAGVTGLPHWLR